MLKVKPTCLTELIFKSNEKEVKSTIHIGRTIYRYYHAQRDNAIICRQEARTCIARYMSEVKKRGSKYLNIIRLEK